PVRERTAGGAAADDDEVVGHGVRARDGRAEGTLIYKLSSRDVSSRIPTRAPGRGLRACPRTPARPVGGPDAAPGTALGLAQAPSLSCGRVRRPASSGPSPYAHRFLDRP